MQKRLWLLFLLLFSVCIVLVFQPVQRKQPTVQKTLMQPTPTIQPVSITRTTLFVPSWTVDAALKNQSYDTLVYFGLAVNEKGINTTENGYLQINSFLKNAPTGAQKLLAVRMTDKTVNEAILQNQKVQQDIIDGAIRIAQENGFAGIVLDLEQGSLAFPSVMQNITHFSTTFAKSAHLNRLVFYQTLSGDTFYLARPYDASVIGQAADGIFVMGYDFHKANGTPGPNFPLTKRSDADYDFSDMISDFSKYVPKKKLTVIFGMFGYDWMVDEKERSIGQAQSLTTSQMQKKFSNCALADCVVQRNASQETNIFYTDSDGNRHSVWYEDGVSVARKEARIGKLGIGHVGFWAYGYF